MKGCQTWASTCSRSGFWMGASCFWNIDRQGRRRTALSRKSPGSGCLWSKEVPTADRAPSVSADALA